MKSYIRQWKATWRDTLILLNEFRTPLLIFTVAVIGGGLLYWYLALLVGEPMQSRSEAIFTILTAAFLQPSGDFPKHIVLQLFHFIMPVIGLIILAQGLADFGSLLFNRRARNKEWEMAVASTMQDHIILVGLGHLGYRVALKLHEMGEALAVIEFKADADTVASIKKLGVPVIHDDATRPAILEAHGHLPLRDVVKQYQDALLAGDVEAIVSTFEPEGYFREPAGGEHVYRGTEALRGFMTGLFNVGGITLDHVTVTDDGVACAIEFNAVAFGSNPLIPQAGVAVYERGASGRLLAARIYDDVNVEAFAGS